MVNPAEKIVDFLVIGGGVAGLRAAVELASAGDVLVLTKDKITESSTGYAQGGIAVALSDEDRVSIHYDDTIKAGDGLCNEEAVRIMVEEGPEYIRELMSWGADFDKEGSKLSFTREAAHSRRRILHAHGDSTGKEIERVLISKAKNSPTITKKDFALTLDLIIKNNRCIGATVLQGDALINIYARAVILATGGAGQLFSRTTNPMISTGDGIAIAYRAGARIVDMEFIQFHPTTLYSPGAPQFLLSEAMRGEGAVLRNIHGKRFMSEYHAMAELASRDTVSRAIVSEMVKTAAKHVYLDLTHLERDFIKKRFPLIYATCLQYDIDITEEMVPVCPAAHYIMGGIHTNFFGETNIRGLFAAGEVACTGVHGSNRLASNSLLEGLVFGARTGKRAAEYFDDEIERQNEPGAYTKFLNEKPSEHDAIDTEKTRSSLRQLMWNKVGIIRCKESLSLAKKWLERKSSILKKPVRNRRESELNNMLTVAKLITDSALLRQGSVGAHYRSDFRDRGADWRKHTVCHMGKISSSRESIRQERNCAKC
ncbi:MAG: L-aspartate oxidase [Nitrospira bacterium SG8_35_4]|nr:MAG: L-aspartate oxidase [Nitrospira bacterium SG8_35_4]